jgi:hypothetical protein
MAQDGYAPAQHIENMPFGYSVFGRLIMSNHDSRRRIDATTDRRMRMERRADNSGPPDGIRERRRGQERRALSVSEVRLSDAEWERYFAPTPSLKLAGLCGQ